MKIFLDLDGTIVDYVKGLHDILGIPFSYDNYPYPLGLYNITPLITSYKELKIIHDLEYFWENLNFFEGAEKLINYLLNSKFDVYILTNGSDDSPGSFLGKYKWIIKNLPFWKSKVIITTINKGILATSDSILIDDKEDYILEFNKVGIGILVPRPWNSFKRNLIDYNEIINKLRAYE